jgi:hypothetical protein
MPVFCTQFAVFLSRASAAELLLYFFDDGEAPDEVARAAMAWLGERRPAVRDQVLCRVHGVDVLDDEAAPARRAALVRELGLAEQFTAGAPASFAAA